MVMAQLIAVLQVTVAQDGAGSLPPSDPGLGMVTRVFIYASITALATGLGALPFLLVRRITSNVVAYSNAAKVAQLGVPEVLLAEHGAVSEPVARAMAEGVRARFGADLGIATTGISGPDGGSADKPVGLVHLALSRAEGTHADHFVFAVDRTRHRVLTAQVGLDWVRRALLGLELTGPSLLRSKGGGSAPGRATD